MAIALFQWRMHQQVQLPKGGAITSSDANLSLNAIKIGEMFSMAVGSEIQNWAK
jgi:hypothetical protein